MIASLRKIVSGARALPFTCAVLTACLLASGANSALAGLQVDAQIKVGIDPSSLAFTPDGKYLYATNYGDNTVSVIDTALNKVRATITLSPGAGAFLSSVAITPDGSTVFVLDGNSTIAVISTSTNTVLKTISAGPSFGTGLAITQDGAHLFVSNFSGTVSIINVAEQTRKAIATIQIATGKKVITALGGARHPNSVVISPDGTYLCTANSGTPRLQVRGTVSVISR